MSEKATIMSVVNKGAVAEALQQVIEEANDLDSVVICYTRKNGEPGTVWGGLLNLSALGLLSLCKMLIIQHMHKEDQDESE